MKPGSTRNSFGWTDAGGVELRASAAADLFHHIDLATTFAAVLTMRKRLGGTDD